MHVSVCVENRFAHRRLRILSLGCCWLDALQPNTHEYGHQPAETKRERERGVWPNSFFIIYQLELISSYIRDS